MGDIYILGLVFLAIIILMSWLNRLYASNNEVKVTPVSPPFPANVNTLIRTQCYDAAIFELIRQATALYKPENPSDIYTLLTQQLHDRGIDKIGEVPITPIFLKQSQDDWGQRKYHPDNIRGLCYTLLSLLQDHEVTFVI